MTNEEAIRILNDILIDEYGCKLMKCDYVAMRHAVNVMEHAELYKWHDLQKNPNDIPNDKERVLFTLASKDENIRTFTGYFRKSKIKKLPDGFENDDFECYVTDGFYPVNEVVAWKYIDYYYGESE